MTAENSSRLYSPDLDVETQSKADQFLEGLDSDREESIARTIKRAEEERQSILPRLDQVKQLGIGLPDQLWTKLPGTSSLEDEHDEEIPPKPAVVIEYYRDFTAVIMGEDGRIFRGKHGSSSDDDKPYGYRVSSLEFDSAAEITDEDYPKFVSLARDRLQQHVEEKTGITHMQAEKKKAEKRESERQRIDEENREYKDVTDFSKGPDDEHGLISNRIMKQISEMIGMVEIPDFPVTPNQLANLLGHIFSAEQYHNQDYHAPSEERNDNLSWGGARELIELSGVFISGISPELGDQITILGNDMNLYAHDITDPIIRKYQVPFQSSPENREIYRALGRYGDELREAYNLDRFARPDQVPVPESFVLEDGGVITRGQICDWLLNTPPTIQQEM